jgi:VCBS repeat-containing protein/YD repeat-containing protein
MLLPPKTAQSAVKKGLLAFAEPVHWLVGVLRLSRGLNRRRRERKPRSRRAAACQPLEARLCLTPVAYNDSYQANSSATTHIPAAEGVLANDTGSSLTAILVSGPSHGSLTLNSDGSFVYTNTMPMTPDSFTYKDYDGTNYSNTATATLNLRTNGAQPSASSENYSVVHDRTLTVSAASGVLHNDSDPNGIPLTAVLVTSPSHGSLTLNSDGSLSYTPNTHYTGSDSFSYYAYNGYQASSTVSDSINVTNHAPVANEDHYYPNDGSTFTVSASSGVLANDTDADGDTLTASLVSGPSHGSLTLNSDGSFSYTPDSGFVGTDTFEYAASDGVASSNATVTLTTQYSVLSAVDETKVPVDTIHVGNQILSDPFNAPITSPLPAGGSGGTTISAAPADGAPATAHNLSLVYDSIMAQPDAVIEANLGLSTNVSTMETMTATLTFNGTVEPSQYYTLSSLDGTDSNILMAQQVDTSGLSTGRYGWSLTVTSTHMAAPVTITGYVNVVNDSSSPFGKGWDMPGLLHLTNNSASGVPAGVLLTTGDGGAYYFTAGSGSSYTSPAGPYAFSTLTSVMGGGWQLVTHEGVTFNFNSSGNLTSRVERTGEETTYTWSSGELTAITDQFGRSVDLSYTSGLLSSIEDFAGNTWSVAHSSTNLVSITEPNAGYTSAPEWIYAYSGNYMASEETPNGNTTSFTLNSYHRVSGTTLADSSTTSDASEQDFGYGSSSSGTPADVTLADAVDPSSTDPNGNTTDFQTDVFGNFVATVDAAGNTTTIDRDSNGLPTEITLPPPTTGASSPVTNIYYDSTGDETYATGAQSTYGTYLYRRQFWPVGHVHRFDRRRVGADF